MKTTIFLPLIVLCISGCYHTDKQTIETLTLANQSLMDTKNNVERNIHAIHNLLEKQMAMDRIKVKPYYDKATEVEYLSDSLVDKLQSLKIRLASNVGGVNRYSDDSVEKLNNKDAVVKCNGIMFGDSEAMFLRNFFIQYRRKIFGLIDLRDTSYLKMGLLLPDHIGDNKEEMSWQEYNFKNKPLVSDIEVLSRLQVDVRNCELVMVQYFYSNVSTTWCGLARYIIYFGRFSAFNRMTASATELDSAKYISLSPPLNASFDMKFVEKGKEVILHSKSDMVTPEMHEEMKKLSKGDKVIIENIFMVAPDGTSRDWCDGTTIFIQ